MYHALIIIIIFLAWRFVKRRREQFTLFPLDDAEVPDDNSVIDSIIPASLNISTSGTNHINVTQNYNIYK
jgi:hypothetical protein